MHDKNNIYLIYKCKGGPEPDTSVNLTPLPGGYIVAEVLAKDTTAQNTQDIKNVVEERRGGEDNAAEAACLALALVSIIKIGCARSTRKTRMILIGSRYSRDPAIWQRTSHLLNFLIHRIIATYFITKVKMAKSTCTATRAR